MIEYRKAALEDLIADAKQFGRVDELKTIGLGKVNATKVNDEGKKVSYKRNRTYLEIKKVYFQRYYPDMLPVAKPKKKTMYQIFEEL
jgi:hypothetical protein